MLIVTSLRRKAGNATADWLEGKARRVEYLAEGCRQALKRIELGIEEFQEAFQELSTEVRAEGGWKLAIHNFLRRFDGSREQ
jgi:hypothetical protein